jgi:hypothetical protein
METDRHGVLRKMSWTIEDIVIGGCMLTGCLAVIIDMTT